MRLTELLVPEAVVLDHPTAPNGAALLESIVDDLGAKGLVANPLLVSRDIVARERVMSTGVGNGIAIPHAYTAGVERLVAGFYRARTAVEFGAADGVPVGMFFVILGPPGSRRDHIRLLAKISRLAGHAEFREHLLAARDPESVLGMFRRFGER